MKKHDLTKKLGLVLSVGALLALPAHALVTYDFSFTGGGLTGNGVLQVDPITDTASSGTFTVTHAPTWETVSAPDFPTAPNFAGLSGGSSTVFSLFEGTAPHSLNGYDNTINPAGPGFLSENGVEFSYTVGSQLYLVDLFNNSDSTDYGFGLGDVSSVGVPPGSTHAQTYFSDSGDTVPSFGPAAVPEVSTFAVASVGMLGLVYIGRFTLRRHNKVA